MVLLKIVEASEPAMAAAWLEALPRTGGEWLEDVLALELSVEARTNLAIALRRLEGPRAQEQLLAQLEDEADPVRIEAARSLASRERSPELEKALLNQLGTLEPARDESQRAYAAELVRSLGILGAASAVSEILVHAQSADAGLRLEVVRAMERIDPTHADFVALLPELAKDSDPRIARRAEALR